MKITFTRNAWADYTSWQQSGDGRKALRRINTLIEAIIRGDDSGKPEHLRGDLSGFMSRRVDREHRLVYRVMDDTLEIVACRGHYDD